MMDIVSVFDVKPNHVEAADIFCPNNPRQTARELSRYSSSIQRAMHGAQFWSTSGPDMSKVGTDYSVAITALMNSETGQAMWAAPQAFPP